ncbi:precorrin-2 dehydrogenase/sirohydrochlorin ferrochelatase family protein [Natranaerofaba carboxydovora]|uniref:precorrin-2 dehydrogenase/sirohydrochlorin ferrochelatase family protein n=1 Tax=Natranaerofaba carboxydovora TaxID=2742683 RepID=UPI001F1475E1|nr:bifunctional precorrin-2 dehydrogenase/sirohydrochlorin ferrochelatase [Natranaerofaba carboxydovora]UMZ73203.1 Precorrin-2 dehydrogenase [Natranaerofaba carboxydovora]
MGNENLYPAMLDLKEKECVVIGGGKVAIRKVKTLLNSFAKVKVISPSICSEMAEMLNHNSKKQFHWLQKKYEKNDLSGAFMVFACTDDSSINKTISRDARSKGLIVNCVNPPEESNFIVPASINNGDLTISVSTGGASPALSKKLKEKIQQEFVSGWDKYIELLKYCRQEIKNQVNDENKRKDIYYEILENDYIFEEVKKIDNYEINAYAKQIIERFIKER